MKNKQLLSFFVLMCLSMLSGKSLASEDNGNLTFYVRHYPDDANYTEATATSGAGPNGSDAFVVESYGGEASYSTEFLIRSDDTFHTGDEFCLRMTYKADTRAICSVMAHAEPGEYLHYQILHNAPEFTTEWQTTEWRGTVPSEANGMKILSFHLNEYTHNNTYYFADISFTRIEPEPEPDAVVISGIQAGSSQQLKCLSSFELGYKFSDIEALTLDDVYVEWSDGQLPMTRVLEGELTSLENGKATIEFHPVTDDLKLAGNAVLRVKGKAQVAGEERIIDEEVPFSAFTVSLTEQTRYNMNMRPFDLELMLEITNLDVSSIENAGSVLKFKQVIDGVEQTVGTANFFSTISLGYTSLFRSSFYLNSWQVQPGVLHVSGELSYENNNHWTSITFPADSMWYLPVEPQIAETVTSLSTLQNISFLLPEGFDYAEPDFSASTVYYYENDETWREPIVLLQSPTATVADHVLTLDFPSADAVIDAHLVFVKLSGSMAVDGQMLTGSNYWGYYHPNFKGEVHHRGAYFSGSGYWADPEGKEICLSNDFHTALLLPGAVDVEFIEASGRIFGVVDGEEITLLTLADADELGLEKWKQVETPDHCPYLILGWELQTEEASFTDLYCDLTATFVIDGEIFEYHSDPAARFGTYFYKPTPSIAERSVLESVYELENLTFEMPSYLLSAAKQSCSIVTEIKYEDSRANSKNWGNPTYTNDLILPGFDFTYTYLPDDMEPIGYEVTLYGAIYDENYVAIGSFTHCYQYLSTYGLGIEQVSADKSPAATYNMQGVLVDEAQAKGLLIRNGKKILIR